MVWRNPARTAISHRRPNDGLPNILPGGTMRVTRSWFVPSMVLIVSAATAAPGRAQQPARPLEITISAHGGGAIFTEFLEQRVQGDEVSLASASSWPSLRR
jgi:hypothetical protein